MSSAPANSQCDLDYLLYLLVSLSPFENQRQALDVDLVHEVEVLQRSLSHGFEGMVCLTWCYCSSLGTLPLHGTERSLFTKAQVAGELLEACSRLFRKPAIGEHCTCLKLENHSSALLPVLSLFLFAFLILLLSLHQLHSFLSAY